MRGAVMYGPGDVRVEERDEPRIVEATDAIVRLSAACVCGSDLWPYRGIEDLEWPASVGHEYAGIVQEVGAEVRDDRAGPVRRRFVLGLGQRLRDLPSRLMGAQRAHRDEVDAGTLVRPSCSASRLPTAPS